MGEARQQSVATVFKDGGVGRNASTMAGPCLPGMEVMVTFEPPFCTVSESQVSSGIVAVKPFSLLLT
jgi:hypothetical protein